MKGILRHAAVVPLACVMITLVGIPLIYVLAISFMTRGPRGGVLPIFTLDNYANIFDPLYINIFGNSLLLAILVCILTFVIGYPFAYIMARLKTKYRRRIFIFFVAPFWTSSLLRMYGWIIMLRNDGVINNILQKTGIIDGSITFLYNYGTVLAGTVYVLLPFMVLPIYNSAQKLDVALLEASRDLGAGPVQTFMNITLPLTLPGIMGGVTLVFIPAIGLFFVSDLLGGAKTMLVGGLVRDRMINARDWPFGAALSIVMMCGVLLCIFLYRWACRKAKVGDPL